MTTAVAPVKNGSAVAPSKASPLNVMGSRFQIDPARLLEVLRSTVIKPTDKHVPTNEEVAAFVIVANQYNLNPFTREIYAFAGRGGAVVLIVGIDGWVSLVNRHPDFNGCEFTERMDEKGDPVSVTCSMHVKGREHPVTLTEYLKECYRPTEPWKGMPRRMLRHKAYIQTARYCFGLAGIFDEDEGRDIIANGGPKTVLDETAPTRTEQVAAKLKAPAMETPAPAAQEEADSRAEENADTSSEQSQPPDDGGWQDTIDDLLQRTAEAATVADMQTVEADLMRHADAMPVHYAMQITEAVRKRRSLFVTPAKKGGAK